MEGASPAWRRDAAPKGVESWVAVVACAFRRVYERDAMLLGSVRGTGEGSAVPSEPAPDPGVLHLPS